MEPEPMKQMEEEMPISTENSEVRAEEQTVTTPAPQRRRRTRKLPLRFNDYVMS